MLTALTILLAFLFAILAAAGFIMAWFGLYEIISPGWGIFFTCLGVLLFFGGLVLGTVVLIKSPAGLWQGITALF